jgi:hypothetical protein
MVPACPLEPLVTTPVRVSMVTWARAMAPAISRRTAQPPAARPNRFLRLNLFFGLNLLL